ncbi:hypothetical protein [Aureimonas psammosilenae]|uniref:hypothetical protein n=1 Tax=Aureimonas psammosilenae TaxID=2495496 RepID=UPI001260D4F4|nr:hypothetical protein [Aureimonas psammosilenae]
MPRNPKTLFGLALLTALVGGVCGYVGEAYAIDRLPASTGAYGGTGAGYGAERPYYGAENIRVPRYNSFVTLRDSIAPLQRAGSLAGVYPSFGGSSVIYLGTPSLDGGGPRVIDVETDRLDRKPVEDDVSVSYVGTAKIIRIAAEAKPHDGPSKATRRAPLEPWSEGWERYCTRTHADFDPARGTFTDENGARRFCTGE